MTETRLRADWTWCPFCGHAATSHSDKFLKGCRANDETPYGCNCEMLPALLSEPQAAQDSLEPLHPRHPYDDVGTEYLPETCNHASLPEGRFFVCKACALIAINRLAAPPVLPAPPEGEKP